jgi:hypothetical protein
LEHATVLSDSYYKGLVATKDDPDYYYASGVLGDVNQVKIWGKGLYEGCICATMIEPETNRVTCFTWDKTEKCYIGCFSNETYISVTTTSALPVNYNLAITSVKSGKRYATITFKPGWNLFSIPFVPDEDDLKQDLLDSFFTLENGTYVKAQTIEPGKGYWMFLPNDQARNLFLFSKENALYEGKMPIAPQWSLIGPTESENYLEGNTDVWSYDASKWKYLAPVDNGNYLERGKGYLIYKQ